MKKRIYIYENPAGGRWAGICKHNPKIIVSKLVGVCYFMLPIGWYGWSEDQKSEWRRETYKKALERFAARGAE
jgi:hypothetical protein